MPTQLTHHNSLNNSKKFPIVLICDGVKSPSNIGSLFRICDALGVSETIFCNTALNINSPRLQKTARSTQKRVSFSESTDIIATIDKFKKEDYTIIALEITDSSTSLKNISADINQKMVLIIGNEQNGISKKVLQKVSQTIHIDMFGENSSMNVVQATSIALYSLINKLYIY